MNDATFQRTLQSVLFDNRYDRYVAKRKVGKLDFKGLSKISFSDKIFKRKEERENKNYSIALLVDCSGSMEGSKSVVAFEAAQKLSKHLASAKINHTVFGFNIPTIQLKPWSVKYDNTITKKLNFILLRMEVYFRGQKNTSGPMTGIRETIGTNFNVKKILDEMPAEIKGMHWGGGPNEYLGYEAASYNNDSDALRFAARELHKQPGKKILIVLSDGQPATFEKGYQSFNFPKEEYGGRGSDTTPRMKKVVKEIMAMGIDIQSIGIQSDAVNKYYPPGKTCSIYDLGQLYDHIIKIIKLNLKRG